MTLEQKRLYGLVVKRLSCKQAILSSILSTGFFSSCHKKHTYLLQPTTLQPFSPPSVNSQLRCCGHAGQKIYVWIILAQQNNQLTNEHKTKIISLVLMTKLWCWMVLDLCWLLIFLPSPPADIVHSCRGHAWQKIHDVVLDHNSTTT